MTASNQGNEPEGFEEHKPSGKKKGPSMKERLIAQRKADEAAAAGGDSAPEAPAPMAMHRIEAIAITGCTGTGATSMPTSAVNTTSRITRGLSSST